MPLVNKTFSDIITFTRASTATYFDATGTLQSAAIDDPRLDYDPATLAARGLLIEEQRTNLLTRSEEFNDAAWTKSNATITADATTSPDGTATADKLVEALDVNLVHSCLQGAVTVVSLGTYAATVFVKADTRTRVRIGYLVGGAGGVVADANLSAGTINAASAFGGGTAVSSSIQAINNGWFRISVVGSGPAGTSGDLRIELLDASGNRQYNGDGVSGVYIWGAQLEAGAFPTSYIPTTTTSLTRSADVASVDTLSPWYRADEGTVYAEVGYQQTNPSSAQHAASFNDATANNRWTASFTQTTGLGLMLRNTSGAGLLQTSAANAAIVGATNKIALAISTGASLVLNGGTVATNASYAAPTVTRLELGKQLAAGYFNGYLRRITYYPRRLSDAELQSITS
jgi:hypothetical protein